MTESDVFISYSSEDNREPPNWVIDLKGELLRKINTYDAHLRPSIWCDKERIEGGALYDEELQKAVEGARIMLCVVSPNYPGSDWCLREIRMFTQKPRSKGRLVKIKKVPLLYEELLPEPLPGMEEYRFYEEQADSEQRPLPLQKDQRDKVVLDVAWLLTRLIRNARSSKGTVVILADPNREADKRFLRHEILEHGYDVEPSSLPMVPELREGVLTQYLSQATFTVLLFGSEFSADLEFALRYLESKHPSSVQTRTPPVRCLSSVLGPPTDERSLGIYERIRTPPAGFSYSSESRPSTHVKEYLTELQTQSHNPTLFLCSSFDHRAGIQTLKTQLAPFDVLDPLAATDPIDVIAKAKRLAHGGLIYADQDQAAFRRLKTVARQTLDGSRFSDLIGVFPASPQVSFDVNDLRKVKLIVPDGTPTDSPLAAVAGRVAEKMTLTQFLADVRHARERAGGNVQP